LLFAGFAGVAGYLFQKIPGSLVPDEDQGYLIVAAFLPPAASLEVASNDIHPISRWTLLTGLPAYLRLRWFQGIDWMPYVPEPHLAA